MALADGNYILYLMVYITYTLGKVTSIKQACVWSMVLVHYWLFWNCLLRSM